MKLCKSVLVFSFSILLAQISYGQKNAVAIGSATANERAVLMLVGENQGLIIPSVSGVSSIGATAEDAGMIVFNTTDKKVYAFDGSTWRTVGANSGTGTTYTLGFSNGRVTLTDDNNTTNVQTVSITIGTKSISQVAPVVNQVLAFDNTTNSWVGTTLQGDITRNSASTGAINFNVTGLRGRPLPTTFTTGSLTSDNQGNLSWAPSSGIGTALASGNIFVGSAGNVATALALSGDVTLTNSGLVTLTNSSVTSAKIQDATIVNADINSAAAIAGTKVTPNFGAQDISTTGKLSISGTTELNTNTYTWPGTALTANTFLKTDAAGNLSWAPIGSSYSTNNRIPRGDGTGLVDSNIFNDGTNVGIGTTTPTAGLEVAGAANLNATLGLKNTSLNGGDWQITSRGDGPLAFVTKKGAVAIPFELRPSGISINGTGTGFAASITQPPGGDGLTMYISGIAATQSILNLGSDASSFVLRANGDLIHTLGRVGLNRTPTANRLEVGGEASKTVAGTWLANSDQRIKTDIRDIDNSFSLIKQLRPVKFKYTDEWMKRNPSIKDHYYYNFIAQEYGLIFPESVKGSGEFLEGDEREILQVDTYNAQIISVKAIQELIGKIEQLEKENIELTQRIQDLKQQNSELNKRQEYEITLLKQQIEEVKTILGLTTDKN